MGSVKERRFAFRDAVDVDRDGRVGEASSLPEGVGGGGMAVESTAAPGLCDCESSVLSAGLLDEPSSAAKIVVVAADMAMDGPAGCRSAAEERRRIS